MVTIDQGLAHSPLSGQPERQARDALLGYDYQIWRTVEIWMQIGIGEVLYIECAEDFDLVTAHSATTNQVKNSPSNITLGSRDVRDAIENHWTAIQKNSGRSVKMRFLTRGDVGFEKGKPFGQACGIDVWRKAAAGDVKSDNVLTSYLHHTLQDVSLKQFLMSSTAKERRTKLYGAIEWVTKEPVIEAVQINVRRAAIERGNARGVARHMAEQAVHALLERCRQVATAMQPEMRSLTSADLQAVFDASTSIQIPATQTLVDMLGQVLTLAASGGQAVAFTPFAESGELPPLPAFVMARGAFCGQAVAMLAGGPVLIVGSEGKGKSIVANLVTRHGGATSYWMELPDQVERVCSALERLLMLVRGGSAPQRIALDDVPAALGLDSQVWTRLNALFESCRYAGVQLLMTARGVPEDLVDSRFRMASVQVLAVPGLTASEVESFLESLGCPTDTCETWAKSALLQSGNGHPKLVYLRGLELRDLGWPEPTIEAFLKSPASIEEARANARQTVSKTVPDPDKGFLYTLSVAALPFSRELALGVGERVGISAPGEAFDRLAGRWIEAKGRNLYSVTNLLNNQAQQIFSSRQLAKAHGILFDAFVAKQSISVSEAWGVFFQALQSQDHGRLGGFIASLVSTDFTKVPGLAESLEIIASMAPGNVLLGTYDANVTSMFRHLQFKIASHVRPEGMAEIARQWAWTVQQIPNDQVRRGAAVIRGLSLATNREGALPPDLLVSSIADSADLDDLAFDKPDLPLFEETAKSDGSPLDHVGLLFMMFQARCDGFQFVEATLDALERLDSVLRARMLEAFEARFSENVSIIVRAWLVEAKRAQPNWQGVLCVFERASALSKQWGTRAFGYNVARIRSIIYEEEESVQDQVRAISVLDQARADFGSSPVLDEQRANIEFLRGNYAIALELWTRSLDCNLNDPAKLREPFASRKAAIAASKVGCYDRAATFLESASHMVHPDGIGPVPAAFNIDAAYCWFKHGNPGRSLEVLARAATELKGKYDPITAFQPFRAQKHCGSCARWLVDQIFPDDKSVSDEPLVGAATSPEQQELVATLPPSPYPVTAVMILRIASRLGVEGTSLTELRRDVAATRIPAASFQFASLLVEEATWIGDFTDFGHKIMQWHRAHLQAMAARESGENQLCEAAYNVSDEIKARPFGSQWYFVVALAILKMRGDDSLAWIAAWREQILAAQGSSRLLSELQVASDAFSMELHKAFAQLRAAPSISSIAAAAIVLSQLARRPIDTCYAQIGLATWIFSGPIAPRIRVAVLPNLARLFPEQWMHHLAHPATLCSPRLSIRAIEEAIAFQGNAPERLLKLLVTGSLASGLQVPQFTSQALSETKRLNAEAERLRSIVAASSVSAELKPSRPPAGFGSIPTAEIT